MNCRVCNASDPKHYATKNGYEVLKCTHCGFGQVAVTQQDLDRLYEEAYWRGDTSPNFSQAEAQPIFPSHIYWLGQQLRLFSKATAPLRVLEIGPGLGGMTAHYLRNHHPEIQYEAIEISELAAQTLAAQGFTIHTGGVTAAAIVEACRGRFDLILGTEVIEHDPDPHGFASSIHAMLKPGGWCAFTTGNIDGLIARWKKQDWYYLDPPLHVSYYTPRSFKTLFQQEGFEHLSARRYGFNYISLKLKTHIPGILLLSHLTGIATGMSIRAQRRK